MSKPGPLDDTVHRATTACAMPHGTARLVLAAAMLAAGGCQWLGAPWRDPLANRPAVTTASADAARAASVVSTKPRKRDHAPLAVPAHDGTVPHGPLYFPGPFETPDDDETFAWSGTDHIAWLAGGTQFAVNAVLFPLKWVLAPSWVQMASDGRSGPANAPSQRHDAVWVDRR